MLEFFPACHGNSCFYFEESILMFWELLCLHDESTYSLNINMCDRPIMPIGRDKLDTVQDAAYGSLGNSERCDVSA